MNYARFPKSSHQTCSICMHDRARASVYYTAGNPIFLSSYELCLIVNYQVPLVCSFGLSICTVVTVGKMRD